MEILTKYYLYMPYYIIQDERGNICDAYKHESG